METFRWHGLRQLAFTWEIVAGDREFKVFASRVQRESVTKVSVSFGAESTRNAAQKGLWNPHSTVCKIAIGCQFVPIKFYAILFKSMT